ncbi:MAG: hypothetical protein QM785_00695 [Pyrinomonadaceae bacterium]
MSNGSNSNNGEWKMPEPVFRSSEGKTPKSAKTSDQEDIDTESPDFTEADTDEFDTEPVDHDDVDTETPDPDEEDTKEFPVASVEEPKPQVRASEKPAKAGGGCAKTMLMMVGITTFAILAIVAVLIYVLFYYTPANTTF